MSTSRSDTLLAKAGLVRSRTEAQKLIAAGKVKVLLGTVATLVRKPSEKYPDDSEFLVEASDEQRFVSRAGLKLEHALEEHQIDMSGMLALDVGQSTGGFTDCLLQRGAAHVVGLEVGREQLVPALRADARVTCIESFNARHLALADLPEFAQSGFQITVMDVSFISQHLILPRLPAVLKPGGWLVSLVKPQFEVGREGLGKNGIVTDDTLYPQVQKKLESHCNELGFDVCAYFPSPIEGGDGNREFLLVARLPEK
ncbi:TlyA family RNA methyltransferase [Teredinibacter turnerae]|uniref:TlyA family RNA methyltransferase n=1 Tax=Teredinibacter turnerae TaxID=2426 RepID=UPI0030CE0512